MAQVIDRRPVSPIEKVMALLQSTRDVSPDPPPSDPGPPGSVGPPGGAGPADNPAPRVVLPEPTRAQAPKLFLAKPSPIKSNPVKPMQVLCPTFVYCYCMHNTIQYISISFL